MYRPNFCSECGAKIVRLHWHPWTSRRFCDPCARRLGKERLKLPLISAALLFSIGFVTGRAIRPKPPPLIIQRSANSPLAKSENHNSGAQSGVNTNSPAQLTEEVVYICGARTKKGKPCSRRVHQPARCWQHKGAKAMLPEEKLRIKE
jgi:hypothetical protein